MRIVVYGLWHLGCVLAACTAATGNQVVGLDLDEAIVEGLQRGQPPLHEPGLAELIATDMANGTLSFTTDAEAALRDATVLWVAFDTPVNAQDEADVAFVRAQLEQIADHLTPGTTVLVSSQVPVGFTGNLRRDWGGRGLHYAYSPENLRLGKALDAFQNAERVVIGLDSVDDTERPLLHALFTPFTPRIEWMSVASAEMTKHALNAFLATSVTFINEVARICESVGADAKEVERGLKSEGRIGSRAYLAPGVAFAGGTLARDVRFLVAAGQEFGVQTPLFTGVLDSNREHQGWLQEKIRTLIAPIADPVVAVLGLTYRPDTSTLRRSSSVELCAWLQAQGVAVRAHDPAILVHPPELDAAVTICTTARAALTGADVAVLGTEWGEYRALQAQDFLETMRRLQVLDQNGFLAAALADNQAVTYIATGRVHNATDA